MTAPYGQVPDDVTREGRLAEIEARYGDRLQAIADALPPLTETQKQRLTVILRDVVAHRDGGAA